MTTTTPPAARERMSRVDTAWLRMDNDVNLMMIVGVWLLAPAIDYETLCRRVEERLLRYERFRQVVVRDAAGAHWCVDDGFDIHRHVVRARLVRKKGRSERAALQERVGVLASEPLDPQRPLWQFELIEDYEGGSALIA
ncbi:MAG: wax ester/triacylglycerol synthase family O-acyltransferase, partial [Pseudomonadota bacterium]|nr:wax ester/triacylglycerol synthase family O-acyltransferase [Pseudomonadota bacterium]